MPLPTFRRQPQSFDYSDGNQGGNQLMKYHHIGIPTRTAQPGETYLEKYRLFCTDHESNPFGIQ